MSISYFFFIFFFLYLFPQVLAGLNGKPQRSIWTNMYMDAGGLGMIVTVAQPIYNRTNASFVEVPLFLL